MSEIEKREKAFRSMTEEQKLLAYAKAKLSDARLRDSIPKFKHERNEGNFWHEAEVQYVYGSGKR